MGLWGIPDAKFRLIIHYGNHKLTVVECEERGKFWEKMVGWNLGVRELEHFGEEIKEKFRSEMMRNGGCEREVIRLVMQLKLRDEKRHQRELKKVKNRLRNDLRMESETYRQFSRTMTKLHHEAGKLRKIERKKYLNKANHLRKLREKEEEKQMELYPKEIEEYNEIKVYNGEAMINMKKEKTEVKTIDGVEIEAD